MMHLYIVYAAIEPFFEKIVSGKKIAILLFGSFKKCQKNVILLIIDFMQNLRLTKKFGLYSSLEETLDNVPA